MTGSSTGPDRGLDAVLRVREVRERDSRIGVQRARTVTSEREVDAREARARLAAAPAFGLGSATDFLADRAAVAALAHGADRLGTLAAASRSNLAAAERRWQLERSRRRAVELLLQRRAEVRRADRDRREATELDDVAARQWLRRRRTDESMEEDR